MTIEYAPFPKIPRLNRKVIVTEKIDGTNACVHVSEDGTVRAGSRTRWITPEDDNFGFAAWVRENETQLRALGPGAHHGEWWGRGIQRGYGLTERRFSLFNTSKWGDDSIRPACCHVVPELGASVSMSFPVDLFINELRTQGSRAAPGFMRPEGLVVFHTASGTLFKVTLEKDEEPKGRHTKEPRS